MPSEITQDQIDDMTPHFDAAGIPVELVPSIASALDAAGLTLVTKAEGDPVAVVDSTPHEKASIDGLPGAFLCGVRVGTAGWIVWLEGAAAGAAVPAGQVFISGDRASLLG